MNKKNGFFYYPIYNTGYCEKTIGVVWLVLVSLDGGIGCAGSCDGSTWALVKLNDSIGVIIDKVVVKTRAINIEE